MNASATPNELAGAPMKRVRGPGKKPRKLVVNVKKFESDGSVSHRLVHLRTSSRPQTGDPRGFAQTAQPTGSRKRARKPVPVPGALGPTPAPLNDDSDAQGPGATFSEKDQGPIAWESYLQELQATDPGTTTIGSTAARRY